MPTEAERGVSGDLANIMIYYIVYFLTKLVSFLCFPRRIYGMEHFPRHGGFILASNHISNLDPVVLGISVVRRVNFMAKDSLFKKQPLGFILKKLWSFPVKRDQADFGALKEALKRLKRGTPVLMFVEGTRRIGDALPKAQPGVGFLAVKAGVPVIPVHVSRSLTRHLVTVRYGPPVVFNAQDSYENIAQTILQSIDRIPA